MNLIDYLMVFALFLLLVVLSLPTIIDLSVILKEDGSLFASVPATSRLNPVL
jgi:hypothetical protein